MMTKHSTTISAPTGEATGNLFPVDTLDGLEFMLGKAKLAGVPPTARFRLNMTMSGKVKGIILTWED